MEERERSGGTRSRAGISRCPPPFLLRRAPAPGEPLQNSACGTRRCSGRRGASPGRSGCRRGGSRKMSPPGRAARPCSEFAGRNVGFVCTCLRRGLSDQRQAARSGSTGSRRPARSTYRPSDKLRRRQQELKGTPRRSRSRFRRCPCDPATVIPV